MTTQPFSLVLTAISFVVLYVVFVLDMSTKEAIVEENEHVEILIPTSTSSNEEAFASHETQRTLKKSSEKKQNSRDTCSVYFAPSSLSGGGGMGLFTMKNLQKGQMVMPQDGPSIPVIDHDTSERSMKAWVELFSKYWWANGQSETALFEAESVIEFQTGMGSLLNSHGYLHSIDFESAKLMIPYDDSRLNRAKDPMDGDVSYYLGRRAFAMDDMEAGDEFFMQYPYDYMSLISEMYNIPNERNYETVGEAVNIMLRRYGKCIADWEEDKTIKSLPERATQILPKTQADLDRIIMSRKGKKSQKMATTIAKEMSLEKRSLESIKERGICMDNFVSKKSSNPRAGNGAIANRFMMKGDVIAPSSIMQITDRDA